MADVTREEIVHFSDRAVGAPPPFVQGLSETLPYNLLSWPNFERLIRRVAERHLGWDQPRIYGTPGQTQFGIDVVGIQPDGTYGTLQAKKYESFGESDLVKAVAAFDPASLPIAGVTRLIIVTSIATNRRQILDKLTDLRSSVKVVLEFWDGTNLDDALRGHPDLVHEFFGPDATRLFTGYVPKLIEPVAPERADVAALVARGPERMPEVAAALARAAAVEGTDPAAAALAYAEAQVALKSARFPAHSRALDPARAAALVAGGEIDSAVLLLSEAYWDAVELGENEEAHGLAKRIVDLVNGVSVTSVDGEPTSTGSEDGGAETDTAVPESGREPGDSGAVAVDKPAEDREVEVPETGSAVVSDQLAGTHGDQRADADAVESLDELTLVERIGGVIEVAERLISHPVGTIESILPLLDLPALLVDVEEASVRHQVATLTVLVAESALCNPLDDWAVSRLGDLRAVLAAIEMDSGDRFDTLRLRLSLAIADAADDWADLLLAVRTKKYFREDCATISSRAALAAAFAGDLQAADLRWSEAIEEACLTGHYADAAEWVFARRSVFIATERWFSDPNHLTRVAHALQQLGDGIRQPTIRRVAELAQDRRIDGRERAAALSARDYQRRAYAAGSWRQYSHAGGLAAAAYRASGFHLEAVAYFAAGGDTANAIAAAGDAGDHWLDCTPLLRAGLGRTRGAALRVIAEQGDLVPEERVDEIASAAWSEARAVLVDGEPAIGANPYLAGLRALAGIADRIPLGIASELVEALEPLVARDPGNYRHSDEWHVRIVTGIGGAHPDLTDACLQQLVELGSSDTGAATYVRRASVDLLEQHVSKVEPMLRQKIADGYTSAASLMLLLDEVPDPVTAEEVEVARQRLLTEATYVPGVRQIGAVSSDDIRKVMDSPPEHRRDIVAVLLSNAENEPPPHWNSSDFLVAASDMAGDFGDEPELFARALAVADSTTTDTDVPEVFTDNPLSAIRISGLQTDPRPAAALLAARLASTEVQRRQVQEVCKTLLLWNVDNERLLGFALRHAMGEAVVDMLAVLAAQSEPAYRAHAAAAWVETGCLTAGIGVRLANDANGTVRRSLASALASVEGPLPAPGLEVARILAEDARHSVRSLVRPLLGA